VENLVTHHTSGVFHEVVQNEFIVFHLLDVFFVKLSAQVPQQVGERSLGVLGLAVE
jgi:hypothetical protein